MHTIMIVLALSSAIIFRWLWFPQTLNYTQRWERTLFYFLFPPLLLMMTAIAVFGMGTQGEMWGLKTGRLSYGLTLLFILFTIAVLLWQLYRGARSRQLLSQTTDAAIAGHAARLLPTSLPYSAQIGWWNSQLVISEGLLSILDTDHLKAVIEHEQAHLYYRDTFCFFWLGWLYHATAWLPNSRRLWEELLFLRELRADWKAAQTVDPLLLAEALVTVAKFSVHYPEVGCAALSCTGSKSRLEERVEALMNEEEVITPPLMSLVWTLTPLITIPWHQC